jgi:hypothetical protein
MTLKAVAIGVALVLALVSAGVSAQTAGSGGQAGVSGFGTTGNELTQFCHIENAFDRQAGSGAERMEDQLQDQACFGFLDAVASIVTREPVAGWRACFPGGVTHGQLRDIILKFLDNHPEKLHLAAASLAAHAFAEAFPCPN